MILARMSELAEIKNNPLQPLSFIKTWEEFDPQVVPFHGRAPQQIGLEDVLECCDRTCRHAPALGYVFVSQGTGFIAARELEAFLWRLSGPLRLMPTTNQSQKLQRLLGLQIPLEVSSIL